MQKVFTSTPVQIAHMDAKKIKHYSTNFLNSYYYKKEVSQKITSKTRSLNKNQSELWNGSRFVRRLIGYKNIAFALFIAVRLCRHHGRRLPAGVCPGPGPDSGLDFEVCLVPGSAVCPGRSATAGEGLCFAADPDPDSVPEACSDLEVCPDLCPGPAAEESCRCGVPLRPAVPFYQWSSSAAQGSWRNQSCRRIRLTSAPALPC